MKVNLKKIDRGICAEEVKNYLDDLVNRLEEILNSVDEDNLTDSIINKLNGGNK